MKGLRSCLIVREPTARGMFCCISEREGRGGLVSHTMRDRQQAGPEEGELPGSGLCTEHGAGLTMGVHLGGPMYVITVKTHRTWDFASATGNNSAHCGRLFLASAVRDPGLPSPDGAEAAPIALDKHLADAGERYGWWCVRSEFLCAHTHTCTHVHTRFRALDFRWSQQTPTRAHTRAHPHPLHPGWSRQKLRRRQSSASPSAALPGELSFSFIHCFIVSCLCFLSKFFTFTKISRYSRNFSCARLGMTTASHTVDSVQVALRCEVCESCHLL